MLSNKFSTLKHLESKLIFNKKTLTVENKHPLLLTESMLCENLNSDKFRFFFSHYLSQGFIKNIFAVA